MPEDLPASSDPYRSLKAYYDRNIEEHGFSTGAVGWKDQTIQRRMFASIAELFAHEQGAFEVYEVGCGLGDFADYLREFYPRAAYSGCDINERMVAAARSRSPALPVETRDIVADPPSTSDYVVASGIFNLRFEQDYGAWWEHVQRVLQAMYGIARRGMAANFLTTHVDFEHDIAYHQDPAALLAFAQSKLSKYVEIRHAYYPWEYALLVYREPKALRSV